MNENAFPSQPLPNQPHTPPVETTPSVSAAAGDLRAAADDFKDTTGAQAVNLKNKALETANALKATAAEKAEQYKTLASEKTEYYKAVASGKAEHYKTIANERAQTAKASAQQKWRESSAKAKEMHVSAEEYIRQNPSKAVLGALGVGFLIGLISKK